MRHSLCGGIRAIFAFKVLLESLGVRVGDSGGGCKSGRVELVGGWG